MKGPPVQGGGGGSRDTSPTLIEQVRANDPEAWRRLVRLYLPLVCHWCKPAGLRPSDVDEVAQDVFLSVFRGLKNFNYDRDGASFRAWLRTVTRSKIAGRPPAPGGVGAGGSDALRRIEAVAAETPESDVGELGLLYRRAVDSLEAAFEEKTRRAFWRLAAGRTAREVADELGMSLAAVYTAKSKILKRLKDEFRGLFEA